MALAGLPSCHQPGFCNTGQVSFILPTVDDSFGFDAFLCAHAKSDRHPSFEISVDGGGFEVSFIDPSRPGSEPLIISDRVTSKHCTDGIHVEIYRDDTLPQPAYGFVRIHLFSPEPEVCTIDLRPLEETR